MNGTAAVTIHAVPSLEVIGDGRALLNMGQVTFRRSSAGSWAAGKTVNTAGFDMVDRTSTDMDANGRGYMVLRLIQAGSAGLYLSTSSPTGEWSLPRRLTALDSFYSALQVTASSSGRAMITASDSASHVRAAVTTDGGSTWTAPNDFGLGLVPQADGSESGLYAVTWFSTGYSMVVASGSGVGTAPWTQSTIATYVLTDTPAVAISGKSGSTSARAAAIWERSGDPAAAGGGVAVSAATVNR